MIVEWKDIKKARRKWKNKWLGPVVGWGKEKKKCTFSDSLTAFYIPLKHAQEAVPLEYHFYCLQAVARVEVMDCSLSRNDCPKIALGSGNYSCARRNPNEKREGYVWNASSQEETREPGMPATADINDEMVFLRVLPLSTAAAKAGKHPRSTSTP